MKSDNEIWLVSEQNIIWEIFFLKNHTQNVVEELVPDTFIKIKIECISWIISLRYYKVCFYCMPKPRSTKINLNYAADHWPLPYIKLFKKTQRGWNSLPASFSAWFFEEKYFSGYILLTEQNSLPTCLYFLRYWTISSSSLCVIIACNHLPFFKSFSNFVHFCPNFPVFCPFSIFCCSFSEKSYPCPCFLE